MPVRGLRSIWPKSRSAPTGIFSTKGRQKMDSNAHMPEQSAKKYAHSTSSRSKPKSSGDPSLRHQKPVKQW